MLIGLLLIPLVLKRPDVLFRGILGLLTLFSLWRLASTLWSVNPLWTFYRSAEYLVIVALTACTVASLRNLTELRKWMNWVWGWYAILATSAWIGIFWVPGEALRSFSSDALIPVRLFGVFPKLNADGLSQLGASLALIGISRWLGGNRRTVWPLLSAWGIATMILAQGRAAMAGFFVGSVLILVLYRRIGLWIGLGLTLLTLFGASEFETLLWEFYRQGQSPTLFLSLSGRLYFWEFAWDNFIKESPLVGYGAFAGPRFLVIRELGYQTLSSLHNTWVETAVEIGLPGAFLLAATLVSVWVHLIKQSIGITNLKARTHIVEIIAVLAMITVRSFFTTALVSHNDYMFFGAIGCAEFLRRDYKRLNQSLMI